MTTVEDRGPELKTVHITFFTVAVISTSLRWFTRIAVVKAFGFDDWAMTLATAVFALYIGNGIVSANHGGGRHEADISASDLPIALKYWWLCYIWYGMAMVASKFSIGIFFLRLTVRRMHVYVIYFTMMTTMLFGVLFFFIVVFQCKPVSYFWYKAQDGHCIDSSTIASLMYLYSSSCLLSDVAFAILPVFLMHGVQMDRRTKYALIPILGLGWIASIAVLVRFPYVKGLASPDVTFEGIDVALWSAVEQGLAITAGNLATLRPLFRIVCQKLGIWGSTTNGFSAGGFAPTIGASDKNREGNNPDSRSFGLVTFMGGENDESEPRRGDHGNDDASHNGKVATKSIVVASNKENDGWESPIEGVDASQGRLHTKVSRDTFEEGGIKAVPASFLAKDRG